MGTSYGGTDGVLGGGRVPFFWGGVPRTGGHAEVEGLLLDDGAGAEEVSVADVVGVAVAHHGVGEVEVPILPHRDPLVLSDVNDVCGEQWGGGSGLDPPPHIPCGAAGWNWRARGVGGGVRLGDAVGFNGMQWGWGYARGLGGFSGVAGMQWSSVGCSGVGGLRWDLMGFSGVEGMPRGSVGCSGVGRFSGVGWLHWGAIGLEGCSGVQWGTVGLGHSPLLSQ